MDRRLREVEEGLKRSSDSARIAGEGLRLLARARAELAASRLPEAQEALFRAECLLAQAERSSETVRKWGPLEGVELLQDCPEHVLGLPKLTPFPMISDQQAAPLGAALWLRIIQQRDLGHHPMVPSGRLHGPLKRTGGLINDYCRLAA
jgi:hypothetical protein